MSLSLLFDHVTWIPANPAGIDLPQSNGMDDIPRQLAKFGELSIEEVSSDYYGHYRCLGLLEKRPLLRDRRTGECLWSAYEIRQA